jgi:hypothetical protein
MADGPMKVEFRFQQQIASGDSVHTFWIIIREQPLSRLLEFSPELTMRLLEVVEEEHTIQVMIEKEVDYVHENVARDWIVALGEIECFIYPRLDPASGSQGGKAVFGTKFLHNGTQQPMIWERIENEEKPTLAR